MSKLLPDRGTVCEDEGCPVCKRTDKNLSWKAPFENAIDQPVFELYTCCQFSEWSREQSASVDSVLSWNTSQLSYSDWKSLDKDASDLKQEAYGDLLNQLKKPTDENEDEDPGQAYAVNEYVSWVYTNMSGTLRSYCKALTGNVDDADDLKQETFYRFYVRLRKERTKDENPVNIGFAVIDPSAYLCATAKNSYIDKWRKEVAKKIESTKKCSINDQKVWSVEDDRARLESLLRKESLERYERSKAEEKVRDSLRKYATVLETILSKLTNEEKEILWLRWGEELSYTEIASIVDKPARQVAHKGNLVMKKASYWAKRFIQGKNED